MYGWEVEATEHPTTDEQVKKIQDLMFSKGTIWFVGGT